MPWKTMQKPLNCIKPFHPKIKPNKTTDAKKAVLQQYPRGITG